MVKVIANDIFLDNELQMTMPIRSTYTIDRHRLTNGLEKETIGFVGLNQMGQLIAKRLMNNAGISFSAVYDRDTNKVRVCVHSLLLYMLTSKFIQSLFDCE